MLDLKFIRENPDIVRKAIEDKNESGDVDKILELDAKRREIIQEVEKLKEEIYQYLCEMYSPNA